MSEKPIGELTNEEYGAREMARQMDNVASGLRDLAQRVESEKTKLGKVPGPGAVSYASVAASLLNDVRNRLGNLHLDAIVLAAYDADAARISGVQ